MRSRPKVKTYLRPAVAAPGAPLEVEVVLTSASETPIEFVELRLEGQESVQFGRYGASHVFLRQKALHGERTLGVGEHKVAARFELPSGLMPSYRGAAANVAYSLDVHVSIPWWPDRRQRFMIPVAPQPAPFAPTPRTFLSTLEGPKGTAPFLEVSLDSTTLEIGGELAGAVSVANTRFTPVRGVDLYLIGTEKTTQGYGSVEARRVRWRLLERAPEEGTPVPFRVSLGRGIGVGLRASLFELSWHLEVVADVVWGFDARLQVPVTLVPPASRPASANKDARRWVAPVGRERRALTWATVAERHSLGSDAEQERMTATVGAVDLAIQMQDRGAQGLYALATLRWPDLGLDLHVEPRSLTDLFVREVDVGSSEAARRVTVRAREEAQARAVLGDAVEALATMKEVHLDDQGGTLAAPGGAPTVAQLEAFVTGVLAATRALAFGLARVPPPHAMATRVPAWEAFAQGHGGRFVVGPMCIRELRLGTEVGEIATLWRGADEIEGTAVRVTLSPPLEAALDLTSPSLSQEARDLAAALTAEARGVRLGPDALEALVAGPLDDPATVEPLLEKLAMLARAVRGRRRRGRIAELFTCPAATSPAPPRTARTSPPSPPPPPTSPPPTDRSRARR